MKTKALHLRKTGFKRPRARNREVTRLIRMLAADEDQDVRDLRQTVELVVPKPATIEALRQTASLPSLACQHNSDDNRINAVLHRFSTVPAGSIRIRVEFAAAVDHLSVAGYSELLVTDTGLTVLWFSSAGTHAPDRPL